jgi:hypothetical protein
MIDDAATMGLPCPPATGKPHVGEERVHLAERANRLGERLDDLALVRNGPWLIRLDQSTARTAFPQSRPSAISARTAAVSRQLPW